MLKNSKPTMDTNLSVDMGEDEFTALKEAKLKELAHAKAQFLDYVEERALFSSPEENDQLWTEISAAIMQTGDGDVLAHLDQFYTVMAHSSLPFFGEEVVEVYPSFLDKIDRECKKIVAQGDGSAEHRMTAGYMSGRVNEMLNRFAERRSQSHMAEATKEPTKSELAAGAGNHSKKRPAPGSVPLGDPSHPSPLSSAQSYAMPTPKATAARPAPPTKKPTDPTPPTNRPAQPKARPGLPSVLPAPPTGGPPPIKGRSGAPTSQPALRTLQSTRPTGQPALPTFQPMPATSRPSTRIPPSPPTGQIPLPISRGRLPIFIPPSPTGLPPPPTGRPVPPNKLKTVPPPPAKSHTPSNKASRPPPPLPLLPATKPAVLAPPAQNTKLQESATGSFNAKDGNQAPSQNRDGPEPSDEEAATTAASKTSDVKEASTDVARDRSSQRPKKRWLGHCKVCVDPRQPKTCFGIDKALLRVVHEDFRRKGFRVEPYVLDEYWDVTDSDEA